MDMTHLIAVILSGLIVSEAVGQMDQLAKLVLGRAIKKLAKDHVEYYAEAWSSHFHDCPGPLSKLRHACGCWLISGTWRMEMTTREYIAIKLLGFIGRLTEWHASTVFGKAWLIENAAKLWPNNTLMSNRMNDAAAKLREVAFIEQQASRFFKMYNYVSTSPRHVDAGPLRNWLSSMG